MLAVFLMVAVTVTMIPASFALNTSEASAATTMQFTSSWDVSGGGDKTVRFKGVSGTASAGYYGLCAKAAYKHYSGKKSYTIKDVRNHDFGKLAYYYGYVKGWTSGKNGCKLSRAFNYVDNYDTDSSYAGKAYHFSASTLKNMRDEARKYCAAHPIPSNFHVYFAHPADGSRKQTAIVWKMDPYGSLTGVKTSTDSNSLIAGSGYNFEGIQYTVYNSSGKPAGTLACNASGKMNTLTLAPGTYTVKETKTNSSYKLNNQTYTVTVKSGATASFTAKDEPETVKLKIKKEVSGGYDGSLAFKFNLTNMENSAIKYKVTTDAKTGEAELDVVKGTYKCEEDLSPDERENFQDVTGVQTSTLLQPGDTYTFNRENKLVRHGTLSVTKTVGDNGPLDGFKFKITGILYNEGVMTAEKLLDKAAPQLSDYDEDAYSLGEWEVNEKDLAALNKEAKEGNLTEEKTSKTVKVRLTNKLSYKTGGAKTPAEIVDAIDPEPQVDVNSKGTIPAGTMIVNGSSYFVAVSDAEYDFAFKHIMEGDSEKVVFDKDVTIENIKSLLDDNDKFNVINTSDVDVEIEVPIKLRDVEYVYDSENTDNSGYETSLNSQIKDVAEAEPESGRGYKATYNSFTWHGASTIYREIENGEFTGNNYSILTTDNAGIGFHVVDGEDIERIEEGITYGKFTVEEVMPDEQKARYRQPEKQTLEIKDGTAAFVFAFDNVPKWTPVSIVKTCEDGNIAGVEFRLEGTRNFDGEKVDLTASTNENGVLDFGNLYAGTYTITETSFDLGSYKRPEGWIMVNGLPTKELTVTGEEEKPIEVEIENIPQSELYLTKVDKDSQMFLDGSEFVLLENGSQVAIFKIVKDDFENTGIDIVWKAENSDIYAPKPQVTPPAPIPDEEEEETGDDEDAPVIVDPEGNEADKNEPAEEQPEDAAGARYSFGCLKGLTEGASYTLKEIKAPEGYGATIEYSFTFQNTMRIVLENQPYEIGTTALDKESGQHMSNPEGIRTIVDTVEYKHLTPGQEYKLLGMLMYKTENDELARPVLDASGKEIRNELKFTPEKSDGTVELEFTFDASQLDGAKTVVFEELYEPRLIAEDTLIASHVDGGDEGQSVYFPEIGTTALGEDTKDHITNADGEVVITDTVEYSNIIAGKTYEMRGVLMNAATGEKVLDAKGNEITATQKFIATENGPELVSGETEDVQLPDQPPAGDAEEVKLVSGVVELTFTFDGSLLAGTKTVAFEKLYCEDRVVGEHSDLTDEDQSVELPLIGTKASTDGKSFVKDVVAYKDLVPGRTYIMRGQLIDKKTGEPLEGDEYTAEIEFTPEKESGIVELIFDIDVKDLRGKTIVVFETAYLVKTVTDEQTGEETSSEIEIGSHRDLNDTNQTVIFKVPQTGQIMPWYIMAALGAMAAAGAYLIARGIRARKNI